MSATSLRETNGYWFAECAVCSCWFGVLRFDPADAAVDAYEHERTHEAAAPVGVVLGTEEKDGNT